MATSITVIDDDIPDDTHTYYDVKLFDDRISTLVTDTPSCVDSWISHIERVHHRRLRSLIVGLDAEWRPNWNRNDDNPVATLQLCVGRQCLIFQILHSPTIPSSLIDFLCNPSYTFVGVRVNDDVDRLIKDYNLEVERTSDLRDLAAEAYGERRLMYAGLETLARRVLDMEVDKPKRITTSRWDNQWLNPAQVQYAAIDAFLSFEIGRVLISGNF